MVEVVLVVFIRQGVVLLVDPAVVVLVLILVELMEPLTLVVEEEQADTLLIQVHLVLEVLVFLAKVILVDKVFQHHN